MPVPLIKVGQRAQVGFISPVPKKIKILFFLPFLCVFATKDKEEDEMLQGASHFMNWSEVGEGFIGNILGESGPNET